MSSSPFHYRAALEPLVPYPPGKPIEEVQREYGLERIVKLASNENPLGPSPRAVDALTAAASDLHLYPESHCHNLREALVARLGVRPDELIFGNGSDEIVMLLGLSFLEPGTNIVVSDHAFIRYEMGAMMMGAETRSVPRVQWRHDGDAMAAAVDANTRMIFVANPDNPVGTYNTHDDIARLLAAVPRDVIVVLDEAYYEYARHLPDYPRALELRAAHPNLVVQRTFSKAYGLAGLRVGYGIADPAIWNAVERVRPPFNVNRLAQAAAVAALTDEEFLGRVLATNTEGLAVVAAALTEMGLPYVPSVANFLLINFGRPTGPIFEGLLRRGVIVRPVGIYGLPNFLRVSIGLPEENGVFLDALRAVLAEG